MRFVFGPRFRRVLLPLAGVSMASCLSPPVEAPKNTVTQETSIRVEQNLKNKVDILFMVDNSPSMEAMQDELKKRFGDFFQVFSNLAQNGTYADLHVGVVTSDFGAGNVSSGSCQPSPGGQRGLLQPIGRAADSTCQPPVGVPFIQYAFTPSGATSNLPNGKDLVETFTCMASGGAAGCGFEHQLESVYAALNNKVENAGFLRDDAILTVVFLTNEDDGSSPPDTDIFDPAVNKVPQYGAFDTYRQTRFGVACGTPPMLAPYGDSMGDLVGCQAAPNKSATDIGREYDISRYIDFFSLPKSQGGVKVDPRKVILVGIDAPEAPFDVILAATGTGAGMQPNPNYVTCDTIGDNCTVRLQHSCQNGVNPAFFGDPPVRLNAVIRSVANNHLSSICGDDLSKEPNYTQALMDLAGLISSSLDKGCIDSFILDRQAPDGSSLGPDCIVEDVTTNSDGSATVKSIESCATNGGVPTCWRVDEKPDCPPAIGPNGEQQRIGITVDRGPGGTPPPNTVASVSCATIAHAE
jgi:hypothetical protein